MADVGGHPRAAKEALSPRLSVVVAVYETEQWVCEAELSRELRHMGLWHDMTASRVLGMNDYLPLGCSDPVTGPRRVASAVDKAASCVTRGSAVATSTPLPIGLRLDAVSWE
jgi:hypothetical protein